MLVHGRCHCGYLTFEGEAEPERTILCHCTDCQTSTGTAFRTNVPISGATFRMLSGEPAIYVKTTADSGNPRAQAFCPTCGTPVYSTSPGPGPKQSYMVRVGALRERDQFVPKSQSWTRSGQSWALAGLAGLRSHPKGAS